MGRFVDNRTVRLIDFSELGVHLDVSPLDPTAQRVESRRLIFSESGIYIFPVKLRYAWPSELDLMALLAGLRLESSWAFWSGAPFTKDSTKHISVYALAQ